MQTNVAAFEETETQTIKTEFKDEFIQTFVEMKEGDTQTRIFTISESQTQTSDKKYASILTQTTPPANKNVHSSTLDLASLTTSDTQTLQDQSDVSTITEINPVEDKSVGTVKLIFPEIGVQVDSRPKLISVELQTDLIPELMRKDHKRSLAVKGPRLKHISMA